MNTLKFGNGEWYGKKDTILAYNDENSNFKPLPFSFDRASSATRVNKDGLIETVGSGQPRIDYKDDSKGALLLEPSRSNLVYPSDIGTPTSGDGVRNYLAPDGTTSAFYPQSTSTARRFQVIIVGGTYATNTKLIYSWYRKRVSTPFGIGYIGDLDIKNLINATQVGVTEQIESDVSGFDRFSATFNITDGSLDTTLRLYYGNVIGVGNSSVAYWGAQVEQGSYATSYIPTQGGSVTRVAESCEQTVPSGIIGQTEGVVYVDFLSVNNFEGSSGNLFQIKEDNNNRINIYFSNGTPRLFGIENSSGVFNQALSLTAGSVCKLAIKYNSTSTKVFINGSLSHTLNGINNIAFNDYSFSPNNNIDYNEIKLYNTALTDQELINLTTI